MEEATATVVHALRLLLDRILLALLATLPQREGKYLVSLITLYCALKRVNRSPNSQSNPATETRSNGASATGTAALTHTLAGTGSLITGTDALSGTPTLTVVTSGTFTLTFAESLPTTGTLDHNPQNVARVSSTDGFIPTTDADGSSIYVSGTYTSYIGQPTSKGGKSGGKGGKGGGDDGGSGGGGGGGGGSSSQSFGGLGAGGLTAVIAVILLVLLTVFVVLLRRYRARKRADRLQGWLTGWRMGHSGNDGHDHDGMEGGVAAPEMTQRRPRPRSDDSFGTPERSMAVRSSASPSMTSGSEVFFSVTDHVSVGSSQPDPRFVPPTLPELPEIFRNGRFNAADLFEADEDDEPGPVPSAIVHPPSPEHRVTQEIPGLTSFPRRSVRNSNRISQLTIRAVPFNSNGAIVSNDSRSSLQSLADPSNPFADRFNRASIQSEASEWTSRSLDLQSFPRPPSRSTASYSNAGAGRSILGSKSASRVSIQSQTGIGGELTPARSDFNYVLNRFSSHSGGPGAHEQDGYNEQDPFADHLGPSLPSPMASSAARSLFFPSDAANGSDANRLSAQPSNLTRIARSWAPSTGAMEEMAVSAGEVVRVISRHSMMPNLSDEQINAVSASGVLGGWALVKRMDPATGISKRGFVPINCLMDTQGPVSVP